MNDKIYQATRICLKVALCAICIWLALVYSCEMAEAEWVPDTPNRVERLADAIFWAEGGYKTSYPYGIRSIPCDGYTHCRRICRNTIKNNIKRWKASGDQISYLQFLANRYAPQSASNDPDNLNQHWLRNVQYYLDNPKSIGGIK